jgi:hypothetical protein
MIVRSGAPDVSGIPAGGAGGGRSRVRGIDVRDDLAVALPPMPPAPPDSPGLINAPCGSIGPLAPALPLPPRPPVAVARCWTRSREAPRPDPPPLER